MTTPRPDPSHQIGTHIPVLLDQVLELLAPQPGETVLDCTVGLAGHASELAKRIGPAGTLILCDQDPANLDASLARINALPSDERPAHIRTIPSSFIQAPRQLASWQISADIVLADLGFASNQLDDPARGLSFMREGPLDMRLNPSSPISAAELVNTLPESDLTTIFKDFGEEPAARRIAQKIVESRKSHPISTTTELAAIVRAVVLGKSQTALTGDGRSISKPGGIDPATKVFQALRIAVNDELGSLRILLESIDRAATLIAASSQAPTWLKPNARIGIISFHSLEDRLVKQSFSQLLARSLCSQPRHCKFPITADESETRRNPRSRSAKLRVIQLTDARR